MNTVKNTTVKNVVKRLKSLFSIESVHGLLVLAWVSLTVLVMLAPVFPLLLGEGLLAAIANLTLVLVVYYLLRSAALKLDRRLKEAPAPAETSGEEASGEEVE